MKRNFATKAAALLGVISLSAAAFSTQLSSANATAANIDTTKDGQSSLIIHKYKADPTNNAQGQTNSAGLALPSTTNLGTPLQGVEFTVTPITHKGGTAIDLKTSAGWNLIASLNGQTSAQQVAAVKGAGYTKGTPVVRTTDAQGKITLSNQKLGLYLVEETAPGNNNITTPVAPFIVTLPMANGTSWNYDVNVYPKNTLGDDIKKTVTATQGAVATWTVDAPVPNATTYTKAEIVDTLDPRLTFNAGTVKVSVVPTTGATVNLVAADFQVTTTGQQLKVALTSAGLAKLKTGTMRVEFQTDVTASGNIPNTVVANINNSKFEVKPSTPQTPEVYYGDIKILKQTADAPKVPLQGAKFGIYNSQADATSGTNPIAEVVTGANGVVYQRIYLGKKDVNGTTGATTKTVYVKELEAPAGYVLDSTVRQVNVIANNTADTAVGLTVDNRKALVPGLPLTGGQGTFMLLAAGGSLLAAGAGVAVLRRRKQNA